MKRPSPALIIAMVALVVALGGTGYAALKVPRNSVGSTQLKANAVTSPKVKNGSLSKNDFKAGQLPAGPQGLKGEKGDKGDAGKNGADGQPGPLPETLPSGKTLTGIYSIGEAAEGPGYVLVGAISFAFPLASAPDAHVIGQGLTPPQECPGNAGNPQAAPGHLCVYEAAKLNTNGPPQPCDPISGCPASNRRGIGIQVFSAAVGTFTSSGTWAVTAP
jgi:hypothetical protein